MNHVHIIIKAMLIHTLAITLLIIGSATLSCKKQPVKILQVKSLKLPSNQEGVAITITLPDSLIGKPMTLCRSIYDMQQIDLQGFPITSWEISGKKGSHYIVDSLVADGYAINYKLVVDINSKYVFTTKNEVIQIPKVAPPEAMQNPSIYIDKANYILELRDNNKTIKRYPIAMGLEPVNRKLCYDLSSTPEGIYSLRYKYPNTRYHKALGVSYPNAVDQIRYKLAVKYDAIPRSTDIGSDIQIHGRGCVRNWTWGCIAMNNNDVDELFAIRGIDPGIEIAIVGAHVKAEHLPLLRGEASGKVSEIQTILGLQATGILDLATAEALGKYQFEHGLYVTCLPELSH